MEIAHTNPDCLGWLNIAYISWYIKEILSMNVGQFGDWSIDVDDDYDLDYWQYLFI